VKAKRIEVPDVGAAGDLPPHDYASAFEIPIPEAASRLPQEWARSVFEDAPLPVRLLVRAGWRFPLWFDIAKPGPDQILGARIASSGPTWVVLEQRSPLMLAHNIVSIVSVEQARIVWVTVVRYRRPIARPLWAVSAVIHERVLPYLLARAARTPPR
jgi:hypothetical protein